MNLPRTRLDTLKRYGIASACAIVALLVRYAMPVPEGTTIYQLPLAAVIVSAWLGGRGPGWLAFLLCAFGILYWLVPPANSFHLPADYVLGFALFICLCLLLIEFSAARWRVERALEESERRFRLMAEAVPEMLWFESIEPRRMLYVSPRFEQMWGRPMRDLLQTPDAWIEAIHAEDRGDVRSVYEQWLAGKVTDRFGMTFRIVRRDGETRFIHSRATLIRDAEGKPRRVSGIAADVTDDKRAEEALAKATSELAHVTRVTTIGQLAASIAHEVNQPLAAIVANAAACELWLGAEPSETAKVRGALKSIVADGQRASEVIGRIRALMARQPPQAESMNINDAIRDVIALAQQELRRNGVVLQTLLAEDLPRVHADKVQVVQVLLNLMVNGMEATSAAAIQPRELVVGSAKDGASGVRVTVRDNGLGLDAESADRLFDPFYTTKVGGIGMGLAISRSIIESHGGRIWATSNAPRGAVFEFTLPGGAAS
jgi:PAS domain S-box-containing protein